MKLILLALLMLWSIDAHALPLTWQFSGLLPGAGTIEGVFSYNSLNTPSAVNVRGLLDNQTYALLDWNFTVRPDNAYMIENHVSGPLPDIIAYTPSTSTSEFCLNHCVFGVGPTPLEVLSFTNGLQSMRLVFPTTTGLPQGAGDNWGSMLLNGNSNMRAVLADGTFQYLAFVQGGAITPMPEASSWLLFGISICAVVFMRYIPIFHRWP